MLQFLSSPLVGCVEKTKDGYYAIYHAPMGWWFLPGNWCVPACTVVIQGYYHGWIGSCRSQRGKSGPCWQKIPFLSRCKEPEKYYIYPNRLGKISLPRVGVALSRFHRIEK